MNINPNINQSPNWQKQSRESLMNAVLLTTKLVEKYLEQPASKKTRCTRKLKTKELASKQVSIKSDQYPNTALINLIFQLELSDTEIFILLVLSAAELISSFNRLCSSYHGYQNQNYPTFELIASLFEDFDFQAASETSNLIKWGLLRIDNIADSSYSQSPLFIDPSILHYLQGVEYFDGSLRTIARYTSSSQLKTQFIPQSASTTVQQIGTSCQRAVDEQYGICIQLTGTDAANKQSIAQAVAFKLGGGLIKLEHLSIPSNPDQLHWLIVRLHRWNKLSKSLVYIDAERLRDEDYGRAEAIRQLLSSGQIPVIISTIEPMDWGNITTFNQEVSVPNENDQIALWHVHLAPQLLKKLKSDLPKLVSQFDLTAPAIKAIASQLRFNQKSTESAFEQLWDACRVQARQKLDSLATRVESNANWDNLILPEEVKNSLTDIVAQVELKHIVYGKWGMNSNRGLGITALFSGVSGTGKTTAAEAIANQLKLDLYKIDLSTVISKYIGETEKNLRKIFDAAEAGGAILLFDEADALFGKRTEVKDSKDRHSNAEISYLLQKMEAYSGLAILTTNLKDAIDPAFKRRLRFVVDFAFPDAVAQENIWRKVFGSSVPTQGLDYARLAELNLTGGNIRSVALNAAFGAAADGEAIGMKHIVTAAFAEAKKLGSATHHLEALKSKLNLDQGSGIAQGDLGVEEIVPSNSLKKSNKQKVSSSKIVQNSDRSVNSAKKSNTNRTSSPKSKARQNPFSQSRKSMTKSDYSNMSPQDILNSTAPYLRNEDFESACSILRKALAYYPDDSGLNFWLGKIACEGGLNHKEALTAFERAEAGNGQWLNNPEEEKANWYWQAVVLFNLPGGDLKRVYDLCDKYLKAMPEGIYATEAKSRRASARCQMILPDLE